MSLEYAVMIYRYVNFQRNAHGNKAVSFVPPSQAGDGRSLGWLDPKMQHPSNARTSHVKDLDWVEVKHFCDCQILEKLSPSGPKAITALKALLNSTWAQIIRHVLVEMYRIPGSVPFQFPCPVLASQS